MREGIKKVLQKYHNTEMSTDDAIDSILELLEKSLPTENEIISEFEYQKKISDNIIFWAGAPECTPHEHQLKMTWFLIGYGFVIKKIKTA